MRKTKEQKGITLIALIITIIVLLILAVVAIGAVTNDGIINYAKNARDDYAAEQAKENTTLQNYLDIIKENVPTTSGNGENQTSSDYGKTITYSAGGVTDWKVFYKDDTHWYIITSDYLENTSLPDELKMSTSSTYGAYWNSEDDYTSTELVEISSAVARKYKLSWLPEEKVSIHAVRATTDLLNTDVWTAKFGDSSKGIEAIGAPTLEMWIASWNSKGYTKVYTSSEGNSYVPKQTGETVSAVGSNIILRDTKGYGDDLYFPQQKIISSCGGYWLSSVISYKDETYLAEVNFNGYVGSGGILEDNQLSVRPLVSIPANLITTNADGSLAVVQ